MRTAIAFEPSRSSKPYSLATTLATYASTGTWLISSSIPPEPGVMVRLPSYRRGSLGAPPAVTVSVNVPAPIGSMWRLRLRIFWFDAVNITSRPFRSTRTSSPGERRKVGSDASPM